MLGFKKVKAYVHGKGIVTTDVVIKDDVIEFVGDSDKEIESICDLKDGVLLPGFIDTHVHGYGYTECSDGEESSVLYLSEKLPEEGTTAFLATTITASRKRISAMMRTIRGAMKNDEKGAEILGIHLEGPFICKEYKGAHEEESILPLSVKDFDEFNDASEGAIKKITYAPELDKDMTFSKALKERGVELCVGHSNDT
ncbi:MAG: amidohydrolase family protein [Clostridia bacterium]|nr:amidohydrolase family protein [Clostridia bacterium]